MIRSTQTNSSFFSGSLTYGQNSSALTLENVEGFSIVINANENTPGVDNFVAADVSVADNTITLTGHLFLTGLKVALTGTNLPTGLSATDYYVIKVDANTIKLATSSANAIAGTAVDITAQGTTADAALTPAAIGGASVKLQASNDGTTYADVGSATNITADANILFNVDRPMYKYARLAFAITAGQVDITSVSVIKSDN